MLIEQLTYEVNPSEFVNSFIMADSEVWTPWLQRQKGFILKSIGAKRNNQVTFLIHWKSKADFDSAKHKKEEITHLEMLMKLRSPGSFRLIHSFTS